MMSHKNGSLSEEEVRVALSQVLGRRATNGYIQLVLGEIGNHLGVGVDDEGWLVAVFPAQDGCDAFSDKHLTFTPSQVLRDELSSGEFACATLRCSFPQVTEDEVTAVAFIFHALLRLGGVTDDPSAVGRRIWALRQLFDSRMVVEVSEETEVGLIGELLAITSASSPDEAVRSWHSGSQDRFDFSLHTRRIDIKTTRSGERVHWFSSAQIIETGLNVVIFSVMVECVEIGQTLSGLYHDITSKLEDPDNEIALTDKCLEILGIHPMLVSAIQIDETTALASIRALDSADVPTPILADGILSANWRARIAPQSGVERPDLIHFLDVDA